MFKPTNSSGLGKKVKPSFSIEQPDFKAKAKEKPRREVEEDDDEDDRPRLQRKKKIVKREKPERPVELTSSEIASLKRAEEARQRALAPVTQGKPLTKKKAKELGLITDPGDREEVIRSKFGARAVEIIEQLEDQNTDGAVSLLSRSILQTLVDLMPLAEHAVRASKGSKGIYQLNQMVNSIREMLSELQSLRDKGLLGHRIVERTVRPAFMDLGGQIVLGFVNLEASARTRMNAEDFKEYQGMLNTVKAGLATYLQAQYKEIQESVIASLS